MRRAIALAATFAAAVVAAILVWSPIARDPATLDDQVYAIASELMCPVCGGQTVAESGAQLAKQMRGIIRDRVRAGQTREQIIGYFVAQFGEGILAAPARRGPGLTLWLVPPAVIAVGVVVLRRFVLRPHPQAGTRPTLPPSPPTPAEAEAIRRDLRELD